MKLRVKALEPKYDKSRDIETNESREELKKKTKLDRNDRNQTTDSHTHTHILQI